MTLARSFGVGTGRAPNEYALFASGAVAEWCAALGITPVGYRDIQPLWTKAR
jgi:hypothetical protein